MWGFRAQVIENSNSGPSDLGRCLNLSKPQFLDP